MQWLTYFLGVKTPDSTTLESAELGFRSMFAWWLVVPVVVMLAVIVFLLYFRERGKIGPVRRSLLAVLRVGVLVFLIALMCRPVLLAEFKGKRPRAIVVMFDNSQSMKQTDRRLSVKDQARVAIAKGLVDAGDNLDKFNSLSDIPEATPKDPARIELVKAVLTNPKLKLLDGLKKHGPLRPFLFGDKLYSVVEDSPDKKEAGDKKDADLSAQLVKLLDASQEKTAIGNHILEILHKKEGDLPAAIVLVTDGLANADYQPLTEAAEECARLGVPLYIYGVGSTEGGILQLTDLHAPATILYEDKVSIPVHWRSQGFKKGTVQLTMTLDGKEVAKKEFGVVNGDDLRLDLPLIPKAVQAKKNAESELKVAIELKDNPLFKDEIKRSVFISDKKLKVLYVENVPRWEFKFLEPLLIREEQQGRMEPSIILVEADPKRKKTHPFIESFPPREELFKYDLIILGDVPSTWLGKKNLDLIQEFVRDFRGGLIVIAGEDHMPTGYDNTPLAEILPVEFLPKKPGTDAERPVEYKPLLTKAGETSGMLDLTGAEPDAKDLDKGVHTKQRNLELWKNLPGFFWHYDHITKLKSGATALLVHPRKKMDKQGMPILAIQYSGKGQVLFMATDETWRWRKNEENKYFAQFWGQAIYQLALPHHLGDASKKITLALEQAEAILNRKGYIYAHLLNDKFMPIKQDVVMGKLKYQDPKTGQTKVEDVKFEPVDAKYRPGEYRWKAAHDQPGRFEIKLQVPGADTPFQYQVKVPPRHELEEAPLAEDLLSQAASLSGGAYYREEDLHRLPSDVREQKTGFTLHQEILLWNPLVFLIFVALITVEWVFRKFANLS